MARTRTRTRAAAPADKPSDPDVSTTPDAGAGATHVPGGSMRGPGHRVTEPAELAPVLRDADADPLPETGAEHEPAPVFPTEADEAEAAAQVLDKDPGLASSPHLRARAVREQLKANGERAARRRSTLAPVLDERAPVFPTEAHVADLRDAIPSISNDELRGVIAAGFGAFLASLDRHEPVLVAPDQE